MEIACLFEGERIQFFICVYLHYEKLIDTRLIL